MRKKVSPHKLKMSSRGAFALSPLYFTAEECSVMDHGSLEFSDESSGNSLPSPPFVEHVYPRPKFSPQCSEIAHHFSDELAQRNASKNIVKLVEELSHQVCKYHSSALALGTTVDGEILRMHLGEMQHKACDIVTTARLQLTDAFKKTDNLPKKDIIGLEKSCRILVACLHMLDRELRRTLHLYHRFPLIPDADEVKCCQLVSTGYSEMRECKKSNAFIMVNYSHAEKYIKERDSWLELEKDILDVHNLDVDLHRDVVLGPVLDYLTLCPMGLDDISGSTVSIDDVCSIPDACGGNAFSRKRNSIICYIIAIMAVVCIGGGVLMGVIYMIVY